MSSLPSIPNSPDESPSTDFRKELWLALALPPLLVIVPNTVVFLIDLKEFGGASTLLTLPLGAVSILAMTIRFASALRTRFKGVSLVFLCVGYLLGECVICFALWFGACVFYGTGGVAKF